MRGMFLHRLLVACFSYPVAGSLLACSRSVRGIRKITRCLCSCFRSDGSRFSVCLSLSIMFCSHSQHLSSVSRNVSGTVVVDYRTHDGGNHRISCSYA